MKKVLLVKYGELALRGENRSLFEKRLINHIRRNLQGVEGVRIIKEQGRIIIENEESDLDYARCLPAVINTLGIVGVCPCIKTEDQEIGNLRELALLYMRQQYGGQDFTFKVETKRADKRYPIPSQEVSADIGGYILKNMENARVDVRNPQVTLYVELRTNAYIYPGVVQGLGGLPYGSSGKGVLLLSGGIDSPVAGYLMAKRGVEIVAVYFHSPPHTSERAKDKVVELAERLRVYTGDFKLYVVPFTELQLYLHEYIRPDRLTIHLKRAMLAVAETIARKEKAYCLITGDSVGQVASQTMHSIAAVDSAAHMPVIRPLAGLDKQEIIDRAVQIDTYDISVRPYPDCCTLFVARHPETKPKASYIEFIETKLTELPGMIAKAADEAEIILF